MYTNIHTIHALYPMGPQRHRRYSFDTPTFYQNDLAMRYAIEVTDGKPIAVHSQSGASADYPLVDFYNIPRRKGEVLL
jgi:hypothetical protein